jgi:histidyl-tRNA synthetase
MPTFRAPRGTRDILPPDRIRTLALERIAADLARRYGFRPIETPLFEQSAVFERGVGDVTDIVEKELFRLAARSDESETWALRPEPTAGIVRAYIQNGMQTWPQPVRLTMTGPMFRYDRPQAGRYREFRQFDVEVIGDPGPAVDAELVEMALRFYAEAGLRTPDAYINSVGDAACRPAYIEELRTFYSAHVDRLPPLERDRLERSPLRLLDSKDATMVALNRDAPSITDHLCDACAAHFAAVRRHLDAMGVTYAVDPFLVRGLDYYTRTAFEFFPAGQRGAQGAIGGGGRYDRLVELLGGRPTPGIGFGLGLDRVILALDAEGVPPVEEPGALAVVVGADPDATAERLALATKLRGEGIAVRADLVPRKLGRQIEAAARDGAHFAVIIGDEIEHGEVQLRDIKAGTQQTVPLVDLPRKLAHADQTHRHG